MRSGGKVTHVQGVGKNYVETHFWGDKRRTEYVCPNHPSLGEKQCEENVWHDRGGQMDCYPRKHPAY